MRGILVGTAIMTTVAMRLLLEFMVCAPPYSRLNWPWMITEYKEQKV